MYNLKVSNPEVRIDLENGIYVFNNASSTGKTYLLSILNIASAEERVVGFTYDDYLKRAISEENCRGRNVVLFDRYDMYLNKCNDLIERAALNSIVLIDCKSVPALNLSYETCCIELLENSIEVME